MSHLLVSKPAAEYEASFIRGLGPLGADSVYPQVPEMNRTADTQALTAVLDQILPGPDQLAAMSFHECLAAMRDIGLFLGSLKRHGTQPIDAVSRLEPILLELGRRTDMIPRDTVHHYGG